MGDKFRAATVTAVALAKEILIHRKTLQVLILMVTADVTPFASTDSVDPHLILYQHAGNDKFVRGWVAQTRGGMNFGARAGAFVAKKRRGEIQPCLFSFCPALFQSKPTLTASRCWIDVGDGIHRERGPSFSRGGCSRFSLRTCTGSFSAY
ncbi:hypothetical protein C8R45DRAFT_306017 [Mycena sanguinolenta]|nr:hypothetical protein C8R45DRAFT_306017 [Mycena sanguinolenta]